METPNPTYADLIKTLLESENRWFYSYELVSRWVKGKWLGPSADRIARDMATEGHIERVREGKYAKYRAKRELQQLRLI